MGITLGSNFDVQTALPLDSRSVVADLTARDAINALQRYEGMIVYVVAEGTNFQLVGGILDANWTELSGGGGGISPDGLRIISASGTVTADDNAIVITGASANVVVTLPPLSDVDVGFSVYGKRMDVADTYTYKFEVDDPGTEAIDGETEQQLFNPFQVYKFVKIDSTTWGLF